MTFHPPPIGRIHIAWEPAPGPASVVPCALVGNCARDVACEVACDAGVASSAVVCTGGAGTVVPPESGGDGRVESVLAGVLVVPGQRYRVKADWRDADPQRRPLEVTTLCDDRLIAVGESTDHAIASVIALEIDGAPDVKKSRPPP